jgi:DSF synthase
MKIKENINIIIESKKKILWLEFGNNHELHISLTTISDYCDALATISYLIKNNNICTVIIKSLNKRVWNMGGDLEFFINCIKSNNIDQLKDYAYKSVKAIHAISNGFNSDAVVISLVQGNAYGGGFECALASDYIVSEGHVQYSFPESLFGTFPGMGAYSFLTRKIGFDKASKMINSPSRWTAEELIELKIIDLIVERDSSEKLISLIEKNRFLPKGKIEKNCAPSLNELLSIVDEWIETVLKLDGEKLELMQKIVVAQKKLLAA